MGDDKSKKGIKTYCGRRRRRRRRRRGNINA